jgi:AcrR family transcriptional regulator
MVRPRSVSDQTIISAAYEMIMAHGPSNLTFEKLGAEVGLVPAALVRRFKTKQDLLLAIDRYALQQTNARVEAVAAQNASPIDTIIAQYTTELGFATSVERFANGQEFLLMDFRDKNLYANYKESFEERHQQVITLLQQARASGELCDDIDLDELTEHLEMVLHGAGHVWSMSQNSPIEQYISRHVQLALRPYRQPKNDSQEDIME